MTKWEYLDRADAGARDQADPRQLGARTAGSSSRSCPGLNPRTSSPTSSARRPEHERRRGAARRARPVACPRCQAGRGLRPGGAHRQPTSTPPASCRCVDGAAARDRQGRRARSTPRTAQRVRAAVRAQRDRRGQGRDRRPRPGQAGRQGRRLRRRRRPTSPASPVSPTAPASCSARCSATPACTPARRSASPCCRSTRRSRSRSSSRSERVA